jgi:hypothetical protein
MSDAIENARASTAWERTLAAVRHNEASVTSADIDFMDNSILHMSI